MLTAEKKSRRNKRCCMKCNVELSWRELVYCFVCLRIENDKAGVLTDDTIQYDL